MPRTIVPGMRSAGEPLERLAGRARRLGIVILSGVAVLVAVVGVALAQASGNDVPAPAPPRVDVQSVVGDEEIARRLKDIMAATGWFPEYAVEVKDGVVFLTGRAATDEFKKWAGDLARNTQGVVAVANRLRVVQPVAWNFAATREGFDELRRDVSRALPFVVLAFLILGLSLGVSWVTLRVVRALLRDRLHSRLMRGVAAYAIAALVFFAGLYIVLRVSGLTQLALTVVGGTGLVGLVLGIAFRSITENFLASIFLSLQRPFDTGDLIEVANETGYVQQLNIRSTVLMTPEGNIVEVPNATMYRENLRNFTTNPQRRESFVVGIGYDDSIDLAQEVARGVLLAHPAVLGEPEPLVLVDNLGKATVDLKIYFWFDGNEHSPIKVRSSIIRLVKRAYQQRGISMPDEAREVVFPQGVPVIMSEGARTGPSPEPRPPTESADSVSTEAEAGLGSEAGLLKEQASRVRPVAPGDNLLAEAKGPPG
ncbi:mechanosensitive ion channel domain-containing protein [Reyranella sp.]|uniref:mechanosensitive ion channel domain-containing protein n=1 Tax=Reyranella sp. TaxID=1929291 RepID=UPI003BA901C2